MHRLTHGLCLFLVLLLALGCARKKKVEEAPAPPPPPPAPVSPPPPPPKVYPDPIEFVPPEMTMAIGLRPQGLSASQFGESLLKQFGPVVELLTPLGWKLEDLEVLLISSNPIAKECLLCLRTKETYDIAGMKQKLSLPYDASPADTPKAYAWRDHPEHANAIALFDDRTVLLGRRAALERALKSPTGGPVRVGYEAIADASSPYFVLGDQSTAIAQAGQVAVKDFEKTVRGLVGLTGFGSATRSDGQMKLAMAFAFQSDAEAGRLSQWMGQLTSAVSQQEKKIASEEEIPEFGGAIVVGDRYHTQLLGATLKCEFDCASPMLSIGADFLRATGGDMLGDGLFAGMLGTLHRATTSWRGGDSPQGAFFEQSEDDKYSKENVATSYSWIVQVLPFLGYQDVYDQFDFQKGWHNNPKNFAVGYHQIGEFLNPANSKRRWEGYPYPGIALTHFVGMSGVEESSSDLAAEYDEDNPNVGVFGYNRVARDDQITDGLAETIMIIGNERLAGPWLQGGGSTIRGVRSEPFDDFSGFHSEGLESPGVYVLMADGSARIISKDVDPRILRAMCTIHGEDEVDLESVPTTRPKSVSE